jgi:hypothetical protein
MFRRFRAWFHRRHPLAKFALVFTTAVVLASAFVNAVRGPADLVSSTSQPLADEPRTSSEADPAPERPTPTPTVVVDVDEVVETAPIPFNRSTVNDPNLDVGTTVVTQAGADGVLTRTYRVTTRDGVETERVLVSEVITVAPVDEVTSVGTRQPPPPPPQPRSSGCHPSYVGECIPIARDADCAGGSGDGPVYVYSVVQVVGPDEYDLDRDGDGYGCD